MPCVNLARVMGWGHVRRDSRQALTLAELLVNKQRALSVSIGRMGYWVTPAIVAAGPPKSAPRLKAPCVDSDCFEG